MSEKRMLNVELDLDVLEKINVIGFISCGCRYDSSDPIFVEVITYIYTQITKAIAEELIERMDAFYEESKTD